MADMGGPDHTKIIHITNNAERKSSKARRCICSLLLCLILLGALGGAAFGGYKLYNKEKEHDKKHDKKSEEDKKGYESGKGKADASKTNGTTNSTTKAKGVSETPVYGSAPKRSSFEVATPAGQATKPITYTVGDFHEDMAINKKLTPEMLDKFLQSAVDVTQKFGRIVGINLSAPPLSSRSLLVLFRALGMRDVLKAATSTTSLEDFPLEKLEPVLKDIKKAFSEEGLQEWGGKMYAENKQMGNTRILTEAELDEKIASMKTEEKSGKTDAVAADDKDTAVADGDTDPVQVERPSGRRMLVKEEEGSLSAFKTALAAFDEICVPVVVHVLQYTQDSEVFPVPAGKAAAENWMKRLNYLFGNKEFDKYWSKDTADTKIRFALKEVRDDHAKHSYLLLRDFKMWQRCMTEESQPLMLDLASEHNVDVTTHINIYVCGAKEGAAGYGYTAGADFSEKWQQGHVGMRYDTYNPAEFNNAQVDEYGGSILAHEIGHHMGLGHPFDKGCDGDGDEISDTPLCMATSDQPFFASLTQICDVWRENKKWPSGKSWVAAKGVGGFALQDMKSCPGQETTHIDPVFNIMNYVPPACFSFFTPQQVLYMQKSIKVQRPTLYKTSMGSCTGAKAVPAAAVEAAAPKKSSSVASGDPSGDAELVIEGP